MTAFVYSAADAERFHADRPAKHVIALAPAARARLMSLGISCGTSADNYNDQRQWRVVARTRSAQMHLAQLCASEPALSQAAKQQAIDVLLGLALAGGRLWETMGRTGPWIAPSPNGWDSCHDRQEAFGRLLRLVLPNGNAQKIDFGSIRFPGLYHLLRSLVLRVASGKPWIITPRRRLQFGLAAILGRHLVGICTVRPFTRSFQEYASLFTALKDAHQGRYISIATGHPRKHQDATAREALARIFDKITDPVLRLIVINMKRDLEHQFLGFNRTSRDLEKIFRTLKPQKFLAYQNNNQLAMAISEAAGRTGVPRIIFQHNSLSMQLNGNAAADYVVRMVCASRFGRILPDLYLAWSPVQFDTIQKTQRLRKSAKVIPVRALDTTESDTPALNATPLVYYADNYMEWMSHLPQVMQTSDELADTILLAKRAMEDLPELEFLIRLKPKPELNGAVLEEMARFPGNVKISNYQSGFMEELDQADLLIASMSTTIEQALQKRIPVLLFGQTERYVHLEGRYEPPTSKERAPVYVVKDASDLADMIRCIIASHRGRPLTDAELVGLVWTNEVAPINDFLELIQ